MADRGYHPAGEGQGQGQRLCRPGGQGAPARPASDLFQPCVEPPYFAADEGGRETEAGKPSIGDFADAIQLWSIMQDRETTLEEASAVFRVPIEMVRQAVGWHPWMLLDGEDGNVIGHDGE